MFTNNTFTNGSGVNTPPGRFAHLFKIFITAATGKPRAEATLFAWYMAAAKVMFGSRPLPDAVTKSAGRGSPSYALIPSARILTALSRIAGLVGDQLLPPAAAAL